MSSEKQFADGLTKSSTRNLLADRLRHHRQKLVWDPNYTSAKKKDAAEREASRNEFAKGKESTQLQLHLHSSSTPSTTSQPQHDTMDDGTLEQQIPEDSAELYEMDDEDMNEETYATENEDIHVEAFDPVEAYVSAPKNAKVIAYVFGVTAMLPTTVAMRDDLDHEQHGNSGIQNFAILAFVMLMCLFLGFWLGMRFQRRRLQDAMDNVYARLDHRQQALEEHGERIYRLRCEVYDLAGQRDEAEQHMVFQRRSANVMAIMMANQLELISSLKTRTDRLRSLIANHQAPCPLGDTVLVQPTLDGSLWHIDPQCPIITLNRTHMVQEHHHCEYCCPRDRNMVTDPAFTGRR